MESRACLTADTGPQFAWLNRRRTLHCNHGPIDLLIQVDGSTAQRRRAMQAAIECFMDILPDLTTELAQLRAGVDSIEMPRGSVARRMVQACLPFSDERVTPMAAVAGAVADEVLDEMRTVADCRRIWVNNGGDIAFCLAQGQRFRCGLVPDLVTGRCDSHIELTCTDGIAGIATSGSAGKGGGGRSFSLGIADSVTVLAASAARADAAATLIANHVDLPGHHAVKRGAARDIDPDSDLGQRQVTLSVDRLTSNEITTALEAGVSYARCCLSAGRIAAAILCLRGQKRVVGSLPLLAAA